MQNSILAGALPQTALGELTGYSAPTDPLAGFKGTYFREEGKGKGRGRGREGRKGGEGREGRGKEKGKGEGQR